MEFPPYPYEEDEKEQQRNDAKIARLAREYVAAWRIGEVEYRAFQRAFDALIAAVEREGSWMALGECSHCGSIFHDSEDCGVRIKARKLEAENTRLRERQIDAARTEKPLEGK
jgi:hypothetical protein